MLNSIGTSEIIDIAIVGAVILLGAAGFWRGIVKELFISASLLLGWVVSLEWAARWGRWVGDQSSLSTAEGQYVVLVATIAALTVVLGYVGCTIAGLPPADLPGRIGGFVLGAANAILVITILIARARQLVLDSAQRETLAETRIGNWLAGHIEWVILAITASGVVLVIFGLVNRRRRLAIVTVAGAPPAGASGFRVRRSAPLAPEAEKIDGSVRGSETPALGSWPESANLVDTVPLTRVRDPSRHTDRPVAREISQTSARDVSPASRTEVIRCVSCGERITENDKFCPRCGRLLISG
jgi:hypothetical protein